MWCRRCLREFQVNGGAAASAVCPLCGQMLEQASRQSQAVRQAREILERWQSSSLFDRIQETESVAPLKQQAEVAFPGLPQGGSASNSTPRALPYLPVAEPVLPDQSGTEQPCDEDSRTAKPNESVAGHRRLVRELPPLPTELLAPPPLMAAAVRSVVPVRGRSNSHVTSDAAGALIPAGTIEPPAEPAISATVSKSITAPVESSIEPAVAEVFTEPTSETVNVLVTEDTAEPQSELPADSTESMDDVAAWFELAGSGLLETVASNESSASARDVVPQPELPAAQSLPVSDDPPAVLTADTHIVDVPPPCTTVGTESPLVVLPISEANQSEVPASARTRPTLRRPPLSRKSQVARPTFQPTSGVSDMSQSLPSDHETRGAVAGGSVGTSAGPRLRFDPASTTQQAPVIARPNDSNFAGVQRSAGLEFQSPRRTNVTSLIGQTLSYLGVLGLTIGTSMVILGHFGGYADYTPTGWLVTTVAQMLLFLGVINLVSGGIEQNNEDVSRRISVLGEQLLRIEQSTATLRGPHPPASVWNGEESVVASEAPAARKAASV